MAEAYKLSKEIEEFIVNQKKQNLNLSCRGLIPLIRSHFKVSLSKSLINKVIKQNQLSSPVGRRGSKQPVLIKKPVEPQELIKEKELMEMGGCFFLKAADLKLCLIARLADNLLSFFPDFSRSTLQKLIEVSIFMPLFRDKDSLWILVGKGISSSVIEQYLKLLEKVPFEQIKIELAKVKINSNFNDNKELHKKCLQYLNSYVQENFFPAAYQFLDFNAMQERFYCLWAKIKKGEFLEVRFFYKNDFPWKNDLVWKEDLSYAANKVNEVRVFTQEKELLWMDSKPEILV